MREPAQHILNTWQEFKASVIKEIRKAAFFILFYGFSKAKRMIINMKDNKNNSILLSHGDGGVKTGRLISEIIGPALKNNILDRLEDSAIIPCRGAKAAFTTDSFVVSPLFFPGGDIGKLCVCGTINDLVTSGCRPAALSLSFIIEEGLDINVFKKVLESIKNTLEEAGEGIKIVTGDTKVVEKGNADKLFINTSGIGFIEDGPGISPSNIKEGDNIIINGNIADHGICILNCRQEFGFKADIKSDCAPLNSLVKDIKDAAGSGLHALRDATRGGLARVLIELSGSSKMNFDIYQDKIPIQRQTRGICEFLGMDPLYIANEGKMVVFAEEKNSIRILDAMKKNRYGKHSAIIGRVKGIKDKNRNASVTLITELGTKRVLDLHYSEQLPRIC